MRRKARNTYILIGVVALLGLAAVAERMREQLQQPTPLLGDRVLRPRVIALQSPGQPARRFELSQGAWQMTRPWRVPVDQSAISHLIGVARAPVRFRSVLHDAQAPADAGLSPPMATLELDQIVLEFGAMDEVRHFRHVRVGKAMALLGTDPAPLLTAAPETWVDPRPLAGLPTVASVDDDGGRWTHTAMRQLLALRAEAVSAREGAARGVALRVIDHHDSAWRYVFDAERGVLSREQPPLDYRLSAADAAMIAAALRVDPTPD